MPHYPSKKLIESGLVREVEVFGVKVMECGDVGFIHLVLLIVKLVKVWRDTRVLENHLNIPHRSMRHTSFAQKFRPQDSVRDSVSFLPKVVDI